MTYDEIKKQLPSASLEIIQRLGHDPVTKRPLICDGVEGPATRRAVYLPVKEVDGLVASIALYELLEGPCEVNGGNRGPWVNKYFRCGEGADERKNRGAWCAAFVTWVLDASIGFPACWGAIRTVKDYMPKVKIGEVKVGDCVAWKSLTRPAPAGHVGIVAHVSDEYIWTIEGNVRLAGGVDGVAARRHTRGLVRYDGNAPYLIGRPFPGGLKGK